jgi:transcriptional regulator with XRE-family HTH domain
MAFLIDSKLFATNMEYYRKAQSYTYAEMAHLTNLSTTVLQSLESGTLIPTNSQLERIASALKVAQEQLVLPRPQEKDYFEGC